MKKHEEGYVMILVLVVMIVMGLVTASILTFSLRNLQNQQLSIERMADKYAAQGEMEKLVDTVVSGGTVQKEDKYQLENDGKTLYVTWSVEHGTAKVTCTLRFDSAEKIDINEETVEDGTKKTIITTVGTLTWEYDSYKVTYSNSEEVAGT